MPIYVYEHKEISCELGKEFEIRQSIHDDRLKKCPRCAGPVRKIIAKTYVSIPTSDSDLKSKGFAKLVRRDKGVYENVTAQDGESKIFEAGKPETAPKLKKRIRD